MAPLNDEPLIAHETRPTQTLAAMVRADERLKKELVYNFAVEELCDDI